MQAIKPEWLALQAQFTALSLCTRLSRIVEELKALQISIATEGDIILNGAPEEPFHEHSPSTNHRDLLLRRIQRYVEWTIPELLPERVEDAETLVNVARFSARLLVLENVESASNITIRAEQLINQLAFVQNAT